MTDNEQALVESIKGLLPKMRLCNDRAEAVAWMSAAYDLLNRCAREFERPVVHGQSNGGDAKTSENADYSHKLTEIAPALGISASAALVAAVLLPAANAALPMGAALAGFIAALALTRKHRP